MDRDDDDDDDDDDDEAADQDEINDAEGAGTVNASADGSAKKNPVQSVGRVIIAAAAAIAAVGAANLDAIVLFSFARPRPPKLSCFCCCRAAAPFRFAL